MTFSCEIDLDGYLHGAEYEVINPKHYKVAGRLEFDYDLSLVSLDDIPAEYFTPETVQRIIELGREDSWMCGEIQDWARVDQYAEEMDRAYDTMVDRQLEAI